MIQLKKQINKLSKHEFTYFYIDDCTYFHFFKVDISYVLDIPHFHCDNKMLRILCTCLMIHCIQLDLAKIGLSTDSFWISSSFFVQLQAGF